MPYVDKYAGIHLEPAECAARGLSPEDGTPMTGFAAEPIKQRHWPNGVPDANAQPQGQQHRDEVLYRMALIDYFFSDAPDRTVKAFDAYARAYVKERR